MAELSAGDVQRIVNNAMGQLRSAMDDVRNQVSQINRETDEVMRIRQQMDGLSRQLAALQGQIQQLQQQVQYTQQAVAGSQRAGQTTGIMAQQLGELRTRFQAVEKFASQMSDYVRRVRAKEEEDEGYKNK